MPDIYLLIDIIVIAALSILALVVLMQNRKVDLNVYFALFVASVNVWILANYISNDISNSPFIALQANHFVFSFSYAACYFLLQFTIRLANDGRALAAITKLKIPFILLGVLSFTPLVAQGVEPQGPLYAVVFGPAVAIYGAALFVILAGVVYVAFHNIRRSIGDKRARLKTLFVSLCWTLPLLLLAQFILPALTGWFGLTNIGILPMVILVYGLYYGAARHHLFDIKLITVRSLAYILVFGVISFFYVAISHTISSILVSASIRNSAGDFLNILLLIVAISIYDPLRKIFNKLTNRLFYRDAYDAQELLDDLNKVLISTYETDKILEQSAKIIDHFIKPVMVGYWVDNSEMESSIKGIGAEMANDAAEQLLPKLTALGGQLLSTDAIEDGGRYKSLYHELMKRDIAVVAPLVSAQSKTILGYIFIGAKKSGNHYRPQDIKIIEIITNEMSIALQNALRFGEIKNFNITLQKKVDDATAELRLTNDKLKRLDEAKDEFISMASHQLRTPLTSIKGYISMLLDGDLGKVTPQQHKALEEAYNSSQRMVYLIGDFLNLSRLQTGKFEIDLTQVSLPRIIKEEIAQLQATAETRGIALQYAAPTSFPMVGVDETKIRQVMMNFIDNAIYYAKPTGGEITVSLTQESDEVVFRVVDNGIGIPANEQHHLFTKFYRAGNARKARPDGTGIGLYMAKKVIIAHGGEIIFESKAGQGSTFGFRLPLSPHIQNTP